MTQIVYWLVCYDTKQRAINVSGQPVFKKKMAAFEALKQHIINDEHIMGCEVC